MARSVEATGKNVAEATAKALRQLGVPAGQAEIAVISRGRPRFFGLLRGAPARVRATPRESMRDRAEVLVGELLRRMRFSSQLEVAEQKGGLYINIETAGTDELLLGQGGVTLSSLEYIVNRLLQQDERRGYRVMLDVGGRRRSQGQTVSEVRGDEPRGRRRRPPRQAAVAQGAPPQAEGARPPRSGRRRSGRGRRRRSGGRQSSQGAASPGRPAGGTEGGR